MIKTILFIIVIAIIAYFIYRSFNESKLKGGAEVYSDEQIWGIVDHVIKKGDYGGSEYVPANYTDFPEKYKRYLMFEYAKGINAYHKNYEYIIKFDNVEVVSGYYKCDAYKYTNNNVELIISALEKDDGNIESCYKLIVKCDDFTDTDSSPLYRPRPNMSSLLSPQNETDNDYEARTRVAPESLNNSNSNFEDRTRVFKKDLNSLAYSTDSNNDNSTTQRSIIEPVMTANKNMNLINNNDNKDDNQEAETTYKEEDNERGEEQEDETDIDNQEAEAANLNNQNIEQTEFGKPSEEVVLAPKPSEQTEFGNQSNETGIEQEVKEKLIALFKQTVSIMENYEYREYNLSNILRNIILDGENVGKLQQALKNEDFVRETFQKLDINNEYEIEYSEKDGWKIVRKEY